MGIYYEINFYESNDFVLRRNTSDLIMYPQDSYREDIWIKNCVLALIFVNATHNEIPLYDMHCGGQSYYRYTYTSTTCHTN